MHGNARCRVRGLLRTALIEQITRSCRRRCDAAKRRVAVVRVSTLPPGSVRWRADAPYRRRVRAPGDASLLDTQSASWETPSSSQGPAPASPRGLVRDARTCTTPRCCRGGVFYGRPGGTAWCQRTAGYGVARLCRIRCSIRAYPSLVAIVRACWSNGPASSRSPGASRAPRQRAFS
jgi:hypothetical protein